MMAAWERRQRRSHSIFSLLFESFDTSPGWRRGQTRLCLFFLILFFVFADGMFVWFASSLVARFANDKNACIIWHQLPEPYAFQKVDDTPNTFLRACVWEKISWCILRKKISDQHFRLVSMCMYNSSMLNSSVAFSKHLAARKAS